MPIAITDTQRALEASLRDWAARAVPAGLVRAGENGPIDLPDALWEGLAGIGVFGIAVPEELGGAGCAVADAAAALEAAAAELVPGPVLPTMLAALLLGRRADLPVAKELVPALVAGKARAAVAVPGGGVSGRRTADGGMVLDGVASPVMGEGAWLLLAADVAGERVWCVVARERVVVDPVPAVDFSRTLARVRLAEVAVDATDVVAGLTDDEVDALLVTLAAAEASGVARRALATAVDHARVREQFGRKIGAFQAVQHLCAEMLCRAELASALAWDAARAADEDAEQHGLAAAVAGARALDAAVDNAKDGIQVLGGIGFTWEHDAHLLLRRALALRALVGGARRWRERAASLALAGVRRRRGTVDLTEYGADGVAAESTRARLRSQLEEIAGMPAAEQRRALVEAGLLMPHWPRPHGLAAGAALQLVIDEELERAGVRRPDLVIGAWAAPTILEHGTAEQCDRFVGPTLRGEISWCQLFSEPEAGSDLASLRTKAVRAEGGWRLTGQKVWTSLAQHADWAICLARTDPDAPRHRGISYFLVDMRSPGIEIRPLREITGEERFNEVFLTDVFVPDDAVVGEVNGGWRLARTTLANERVAMSGGSTLGEGVERLLTLVGGRSLGAEERLGGFVADGTACSVLDLRSVMRSLGGQDPGAESSVRKLIGVRHRQEVAEEALLLLGIEAAEITESTVEAQHEFLLSRCLSIAGGTTQVLLSVAAERLLGLPRG